MKSRLFPIILAVALAFGLVATPADAQVRLKWRAIAADYSFGTEATNGVGVDATAAARSVVLASGFIRGDMKVVANTSGGNSVTVTAPTGSSIVGVSSVVLASQGDTATFYADGAGNWYRDTAEGYSTASLTVSGATALNGGITCDTSAFTVADTSGNVATAGTLTVAGAATMLSDAIGGGYGSTGCTISSAGVIQANGAITTDGNLTALSADIGGGYGSTGATISSGGNIQANGTLTVDSTSTLTGAVTATSTIAKSGANASAVTIKTATASTAALSGASGNAGSNLIPAGSFVLGVVTRVTTTVTSADGATSFKIGDGTTTDRWGAGIAFTQDTVTTGTAFKAATAPIYYASATNVVITATANTFSGGVVEVVVFYIDFTAPTS